MSDKVRNYFLLFTISLIWGSQFALNQTLLEVLPSIWIAILRIFLGMTTISFLLFLGKKEKITYQTKDYLLFILIGFLESALPLNLMLWGQEKITGGTAGILISTVPIWVVLLSSIYQRKIIWLDICTVILGFAGVFILLKDQMQTGFELVRALALLLAACSFATAILCIDHTLSRFPPLTATRNILIGAFITLIIFLPFSNNFSEILNITWSVKIVSVLLTVGIVCTGLVWLAYTQLIQRAGASFTSMANYLMPAIGVLWGFLFFSEVISVSKIFALLMIVFALFLKPLFQKYFSRV